MEDDNLEALRDGKIHKTDEEGNRMVTFRNTAELAHGRRVSGPQGSSDDQDEEVGSDGDFFER